MSESDASNYEDSEIPPYNDKLKDFAVELFKINEVKFGEFENQLGQKSPIKCDLDIILSHPKTMEKLAEILKLYLEWNCNIYEYYDYICNISFNTIPITTLLSTKLNLPIVIRKNNKIQGSFPENYTCIIVGDILDCGSAILETIKDLNAHTLECYSAVTLLDLEKGTKELLISKDIKVLSLYRLTEFMGYLREDNCIDDLIENEVKNYIESTKIVELPCHIKTLNRLQLSYINRAKLAKNTAAVKLFKIMAQKQTNLCVATNTVSMKNLLDVANHVGPHICTLKVHIDILEDFDRLLLTQLKEIAAKHNFLLYADKKFCDNFDTVKLQYSKGMYHISSWAQIVSVLFNGRGALEAIKHAKGNVDKGVFLSLPTGIEGSLLSENYKLVLEYPELIAGIECQLPLFLDNPGLIQLTTGAQMKYESDLGHIVDAEETVLKCGADIVVVGQAISNDFFASNVASHCKKVLWDTYLKRIEKSE